MKLLVFLLIILLSFNAQSGQRLTYSVNGELFEGYLSKPDNKTKGLVIIIHDWDGLTEYEETRANMLSKLGYSSFAIDLYGKGNRPNEFKLKKAETKKLYENRQRMRSLIIAGIRKANKENSKVFVVGYCFGGAASLELARSGKAPNIAGYASFHGGVKTPKGQSYPQNTPPIFIAHGGADKSIKSSDVFELGSELEKNNLPYEINIYSGAPHAFTVFKSKRYRQIADKKSWESFLNFLNVNM